MVFYDYVEIVCGVIGLMQGVGELGVLINFVCKCLMQDFCSEVVVLLVYFKGGWVEFDILGLLNDSGMICGWLVGVVDSCDGIFDGYYKDKYVLFGVFEVDLIDSIIFSIGFSYQKINVDGVIWGGLQLFFIDGGLIDWDKGVSIGQDWIYVNIKWIEFYVLLEYVFQNGWIGCLVYIYVKNDMDVMLVWFYGMFDCIMGDGFSGYGMCYDGGYKQNNLNVILNGDFQVFGCDY